MNSRYSPLLTGARSIAKSCRKTWCAASRCRTQTHRRRVQAETVRLRTSAIPLHLDSRDGSDASRYRRIMIAKQVLDVIDQQLLMLHLVFKAEPHKQRKIAWHLGFLKRFRETRASLRQCASVRASLLHGRSRTSAALFAFDPRAKALVIGIEVEKKIFRVRSCSPADDP